VAIINRPTYHLKWTIGQVLQEVRDYFTKTLVGNGVAGYTASQIIGTLDGVRTLTIRESYPQGADTIQDDRVMMLVTLGETKTLNPHQLPYIQGSSGMSVHRNNGPGNGFKSSLQVTTHWNNWLITPKTNLLTAWLDQAPGAGTSVNASKLGGKVQLYESRQEVNTPLEDLWLSEGLLVLNAFAAGVDTTQSAAWSAPAGWAPPPLAVEPGAIVQALRELAEMDTDVSINNGAAIYSVRSRVVTEP